MFQKQLEKDPQCPGKPPPHMTGVPPAWMERVESFLTLRTSAAGLAVYPLCGPGQRMAPLGKQAVERAPGGFRIHLQARGDACSPWYEFVAAR